MVSRQNPTILNPSGLRATVKFLFSLVTRFRKIWELEQGRFSATATEITYEEMSFITPAASLFQPASSSKNST